MRTVLFTGNVLNNNEIFLLEEKGIRIKVAKNNESEEKLNQLLGGCEGYIVGGDEIVTEKLISNHKDTLKIISFFGVGYEKYIDVKAASLNGIVVTNAPKVNARSVAEYTIGLMLDAVNKLTYMNNMTKKGVWSKYRTQDLYNKKIGIIGLGNIGTLVAKILSIGFGAKVFYNDHNRKIELEQSYNLGYFDIEELLKTCDIISLHVNYSKDNINIISKESFTLMNTNSILINTARAELINKADLIDALRTNKLSVIAMDGYYEEPINYEDSSNIELLSFDDNRLILTSHNAFNSDDAIKKTKDMVLESILTFFDVGDCNNIVNKKELNLT